MPINTQVKRLVHVRSRNVSDAWPEVPQVHPRLVERFSELGDFNRDLKLWAERLRNLIEPDNK